MTRSSQQTYIQRLGFQDKDKADPRHGLACEYLAEKLIKDNFISGLTEHEITKKAFKSFAEEIGGRDAAIKKKEMFKLAVSAELQGIHDRIRKKLPISQFTDVPITSKAYNKNVFVNGFADVLICGQLFLRSSFDILGDTMKAYIDVELYEGDPYHSNGHLCLSVLGEVKITPEPAESILQQIKFYREFVKVSRVIVLVDFDASQLKRITQGSDIEVYRLGESFKKWAELRSKMDIDEF